MKRALGTVATSVLLAAALSAASRSEIADAAMAGNTSVVRALLEKNADVNMPQVDGTTALHWAVQSNNLEMTEMLLRAGAAVSAANQLGAAPMQLAAINGNAGILESLIKAGADPNARLSPTGDTALMIVARSGAMDAVHKTLENRVPLASEPELSNGGVWLSRRKLRAGGHPAWSLRGAESCRGGAEGRQMRLVPLRYPMLAAAVCAGICSGALPLSAHHAFAAEFDAKKPVRLEGKVTQMEWINPHAWIHIDVVSADGKVTNWMVECGPPGVLLRRGFTKTSLESGTEVVALGYQAKDGGVRANASIITFKDGRRLFAGGSNPDVPENQGKQ
jgi:hypothetical protein